MTLQLCSEHLLYVNRLDFIQVLGSLLMIYGYALPPSGCVWNKRFEGV